LKNSDGKNQGVTVAATSEGITVGGGNAWGKSPGNKRKNCGKGEPEHTHRGGGGDEAVQKNGVKKSRYRGYRKEEDAIASNETEDGGKGRRSKLPETQ